MATATINTGKAEVRFDSIDAVLSAMAAGQVNLEQGKDAIKQLTAKSGGDGKITLKVSEKGAVSVYGLQRWPITLYREQWTRLLEFAKTGAIDEFIAKNKDQLKTKG